MVSGDPLSEGVRTLLKSAAKVLPATGFGVVQTAGAEHVVLTYADAFGATAYRAHERDIPEPLRPGAAGPNRLTAAELAANPLGLVESRLLHTTFSEDIQRHYSARQIVTLPISATNPSATMVVGLSDSNPPGVAARAELDALAACILSFLTPAESLESEIHLLRRLESVERLLPALFCVLDVREIFDRLSAITRDVLRHDFASLGVLSDDLEQMDLYVQTSPESYPRGGRMPYPPVQTAAWLYRIVDDLTAHPTEGRLESARAGGRSSLRVAIRLEDSILGALNFTSRDPAPYSAVDLTVAQRIADYVGLALSHHRLAEQSRRHEELRARGAKSDLVDELVASITSTGELPVVFERISNAAQQVLAHDALILTVRLPNTSQGKVYASKTPPGQPLPDVLDVPPAILANPGWEFDLVDDLQTSPEQRNLWTTQQGYRATLRMPIRVDNEFVAGLSFLSFTPHQYEPADVAVARRITDRVALAFARERGAVLQKRADEATARASRLEERVRSLTEELDERTGFRRVIGESTEWRLVLKQATQVAATEATVLLLGESGTGKEVVARFLHRASARHHGPFVALNCAALPEQLLEAELFGYERGAYTGAVQSKPGQLEQAAGGTLFLDEVAEMSPSSQAKFLRVLQEREFQRLGGTRVLRTDARVVAATNRDLQQAMSRGQFRDDLYYRLNVFEIRLPPLRERRSDIVPLSEAFLAEICRGLGRPAAGISVDGRRLLMEYHFPGNVRELRNILERAAILCEGGLITGEHLALNVSPASAQVGAAASAASPHPVGDLPSVEREMILQALQRAGNNKSKAARILGLTRAQLRSRIEKHGLPS